MLGKGLAMYRGYEGLYTQGYEGLVPYEGLYIVDTTALQRPVQIVRQTISNLDMSYISLLAYHIYKGLSRFEDKIVYIVNHIRPGNIKDIPNHYIYKHYMPDMNIFGYKRFEGLKV